MMDWLTRYAEVISASASVGMLFIWSLYAWLFYQEFLRQRGCRLFIHEAGGGSPQSACLLVNLSKEPVHIICSIASRDGASIRLRDTTDSPDISPVQQSKQGPLAAGSSMMLGSFESICGQLDDAGSREGDEDTSVDIRVAVLHGFRTWPIGARRRFRVEKNLRWVTPDEHETEQLRSRRQSGIVRGWLDECDDRSG